MRNLTEKIVKKENFEKEIIQSNYRSLQKVLFAPQNFLIKQLKEEGTVNLLINTIKLFCHKPKLFKNALTKLKKLVENGNDQLLKYTEQISLNIDLLVLPHLFVSVTEKEMENIYEIVQDVCSSSQDGLIGELY